MWLYMCGCVDCHGVNGPGRVPVIMGEAVPTDITYEVLVQEEHGEEEHEAHPPALMRRSDRYSGRCEPCRETAGSHHARVADIKQGPG